MAKELRWEHLVATGQTGTGSNAVAEFRNDSSVDIHIRELEIDVAIDATVIVAHTGTEAWVEVSKSPVFAALTNGNVFFSLLVGIGASISGIVTANQGYNKHRSKMRKYARGQLTLEPGESLYLNYLGTDIDTTTSIDAHVNIGYEF